VKEKVWVYVPATNRNLLESWSTNYTYDTVDLELGNCVAYSFFTHTSEYHSLMNFLQTNQIGCNIFRRVYRFTKKEIGEAEILVMNLDEDAKDAENLDPTYRRCDACNHNVPLKERSSLHVEYKRIRKFDITTPYNSHGVEIIVSERMRRIFQQEAISGVDYGLVFQLGTERSPIEGFYHLKLQEGIGPVVEPSIVEKKNLCDRCGFYENYFCKTLLYFKRDSWQGKDICFTRDWFGVPPRSQGKWLIVSNKMYKVLIQNQIKFIYFQPAFLID
jgi:hypothetical protein